MAEVIADQMNGYKVFVTKSTVPVGTGERIRQIIGSRLKEHFDFDIVSNPEFLREGSAIEDFMRPNRVVIGATSQQAVTIWILSISISVLGSFTSACKSRA